MAGGSTGRYHSPLRYPGGKGKITNYFKLLLTQNRLLGVDYVEPYAGGASVGLALLYEDYVGHIHINDLNGGVHAFWDAALNHTDALCDRILASDPTIKQWRQQRDVHRAGDKAPLLDRAFATFFLNRTNRSGIISGGVIGGLDQTGPYKIDARYGLDDLVRRIRKVGRHRDRITLTRLDAAELLAQWADRDDPAFFYLDPPYYVKGEGLYDNFYEHADHEAVARGVFALKHPWVVSYDAAPQITRMYAAARSIRYGLSYSAAERQSGSEVMFYSDHLVVPDESPSNVPTAGLNAWLAVTGSTS